MEEWSYCIVWGLHLQYCSQYCQGKDLTAIWRWLKMYHSELLASRPDWGQTKSDGSSDWCPWDLNIFLVWLMQGECNINGERHNVLFRRKVAGGVKRSYILQVITLIDNLNRINSNSLPSDRAEPVPQWQSLSIMTSIPSCISFCSSWLKQTYITRLVWSWKRSSTPLMMFHATLKQVHLTLKACTMCKLPYCRLEPKSSILHLALRLFKSCSVIALQVWVRLVVILEIIRTTYPVMLGTTIDQSWSNNRAATAFSSGHIKPDSLQVIVKYPLVEHAHQWIYCHEFHPSTPSHILVAKLCHSMHWYQNCCPRLTHVIRSMGYFGDNCISVRVMLDVPSGFPVDQEGVEDDGTGQGDWDVVGDRDFGWRVEDCWVRTSWLRRRCPHH